MELELISIIVPVYNVEDYLEDCVHDVISQTYPCLEIILVDDGSTDSSGKLCDRLASEDSRIVVLHKANGGLSDARNYGLERARGDIVSFVDSDDRISPIFIETLYIALVATDSPIAGVPGGEYFAADASPTFESNTANAISRVVKLSAEKYIEGMLYQSYTTGVQWRIYRKFVLGENPFPIGILYEDLATTYLFAMRAQTIALVNCRRLYAYRLRPTSIIRQSYHPKKRDSALMVSKQMYRDISSVYPKLESAAASRCFSVNRLVFAQIPISNRADRTMIWEQLRKYANTVTRDSHARARERLAARIALLGQIPFTLFCVIARKLGLVN